MNYKIIYDSPADLLVVRTSGRMNADDFIAMAKDLLRDFSADGNVLFDHTRLNFRHASYDDLQKIRNFHVNNEERIGQGKSAILVKFGLSDEWHKLWSQGKKIKTGNKVRVFENYDSAVQWMTEAV